MLEFKVMRRVIADLRELRLVSADDVLGGRVSEVSGYAQDVLADFRVIGVRVADTGVQGLAESFESQPLQQTEICWVFLGESLTLLTRSCLRFFLDARCCIWAGFDFRRTLRFRCKTSLAFLEEELRLVDALVVGPTNGVEGGLQFLRRLWFGTDADGVTSSGGGV